MIAKPIFDAGAKRTNRRFWISVFAVSSEIFHRGQTSVKFVANLHP